MPNAMHGEETKRQLASAFQKLAKGKALEKITIKEITDCAGVNRQTFYYHFEDIFDLIKWILQENAIKLLREHEGALFWQEGILQLFQHIEENREFYKKILDSIGRGHFRRFVFTDVSSMIDEVIHTMAECDTTVSKEYLAFLTHFFTIAFAAITESWLLGEMEESAEELVNKIDETLNVFSIGMKHKEER